MEWFAPHGEKECLAGTLGCSFAPFCFVSCLWLLWFSLQVKPPKWWLLTTLHNCSQLLTRCFLALCGYDEEFKMQRQSRRRSACRHPAEVKSLHLWQCPKGNRRVRSLEFTPRTRPSMNVSVWGQLQFCQWMQLCLVAISMPVWRLDVFFNEYSRSNMIEWLNL